MKMGAEKEIIRRSIKLAAMLNTRISAENFLSVLTDNSEENYVVFTRFACQCSDTILSVLYQLRYFSNDTRVLHIAAEAVEMRRMFGHEEDVGGHIANLLAHLSTGKYSIFIFYISLKLNIGNLS